MAAGIPLGFYWVPQQPWEAAAAAQLIGKREEETDNFLFKED